MHICQAVDVWWENRFQKEYTVTILQALSVSSIKMNAIKIFMNVLMLYVLWVSGVSVLKCFFMFIKMNIINIF